MRYPRVRWRKTEVSPLERSTRSPAQPKAATAHAINAIQACAALIVVRTYSIRRKLTVTASPKCACARDSFPLSRAN